MHNCKPPGRILEDWLKPYSTTVGNYGHLLLEQQAASDDALVKAFVPYFESAHQDAREHFHNQIGIDLHPDADSTGSHANYPGCLPPTARRGLFGEVMAGMLTEHYAFVGNHNWEVPIFLFRHHEDVEHYLFALARNPARIRAVFGRFGSDFLAIELDEKGHVTRYLAGEAKWRKSLTQGVVDKLMLGETVKDENGEKAHSGRGIWYQLNVDTDIPHGLRQLQRLLKERDSEVWSAAILSIDKALMLKNSTSIPRTNLVLLSGNGGERREQGSVFIEWECKPADYKSPHDLQVVELILSNGECLIDKIYDSLWNGV
jgi:hypothetical protein